MISLLTVEAQSILDTLYNAVVAWDREPPFKSSVIVATIPEARRYHAASRSIVLVLFEVLPPPRRAAMDRFATIGTLGLNGHGQFIEVSDKLLMANELGRS